MAGSPESVRREGGKEERREGIEGGVRDEK